MLVKGKAGIYRDLLQFQIRSYQLLAPSEQMSKQTINMIPLTPPPGGASSVTITDASSRWKLERSPLCYLGTDEEFQRLSLLSFFI